MPIRAVFSLGQTDITVNGLHQWDYGQQLEIRADDLPGVIEVHFACAGMTEAAVRTCSIVNGVGTVAIPDDCLEQTSPILAWIYEIKGTTGKTTKTITLKVIPRAKPLPGESIPTQVSDKYTEAITAMNEQVESLKSGEVVVKSAINARNAEDAEMAKEAKEATHATTADMLVPSWVTLCTERPHQYSTDNITVGFEKGKTYLINVLCKSSGDDATFIMHIPQNANFSISNQSFWRGLDYSGNVVAMYSMCLSYSQRNGGLAINIFYDNGNPMTLSDYVTIRYMELG